MYIHLYYFFLTLSPSGDYAFRRYNINYIVINFKQYIYIRCRLVGLYSQPYNMGVRIQGSKEESKVREDFWLELKRKSIMYVMV